MFPTQVLYALDQTLSHYESRRAAGVELSSSAPLLSVDEGLAPLYTADDLVRQYNCGDLNSSLFAPVVDQEALVTASGAGSPPDVAVTRQINNYFRRELIDKRNRRMAGRIDRLLTDQPDLSFFFAFGAGTVHRRRRCHHHQAISCGSVVRTSVFGWRTFPDLRRIYG